MKRKLLISLVVIVLIGGIGGYLYANKPHRDILNEEPVYTGDIGELRTTLNESQTLFDSLYADEVVVLTGNITQVNEASFSFESIVICQPDSTVGMDPFKRGENMTIKGRIVGSEEDLIEGYIIRMDHVGPAPQ